MRRIFFSAQTTSGWATHWPQDRSQQQRPEFAGQPGLLVPGEPLGATRFSLWSMSHSGTDRRELTEVGVDELEPVLSPDGTRIVFSVVHARGGRTADLFLMGVDGSERTQLTHVPAGTIASAPTWSPDGTQVAFSTFLMGEDGEGADTVHIIPVQTGGEAMPVTEGQHPAWTPDGQRLTYTGVDIAGEPRLEDVDLATGRLKVHPVGTGLMGAWDSTGRLLAYTYATAKETGLAIADTCTGTVQKLTQHPGDGPADVAPQWLDSDTLIFSRWGDDVFGTPLRSEIHTLSLADRSERRLSPEGALDLFGGSSMVTLRLAYMGGE